MSFLKAKINSELDERFLESLYLYINDDEWQVNVFFYVATSKEIKQNWLSVRNALAVTYQSDLVESEIKTEFKRWNMYIIFIAHDSISKSLKNAIESDKFSSRKIVEDCFEGEFSDASANELIIKHITSTDLDELINYELDKKKQQNTSLEYTPANKFIWNSIPVDDLKRDINTQDSILAELEKTISNED
ncbi:ABC-three component system middle component 1 [Maribellus sediminis]|uniref:ABC-three component system middle component 1 n=1 Tax=Maribellus sediminis TaxID=2696285 RepID=UPI00142FD138|nr:ABC-three component system middle component 1 [Maribellus sediminis]